MNSLLLRLCLLNACFALFFSPVFAGELQLTPDAKLAAHYKERELSASPEIKAKLADMRKKLGASQASFQVGYTSAMDRPIEQLCGYKKSNHPVPPANLQRTPHASLRDRTELSRISNTDPTTLSNFDWRNQAKVTPVRNQGSCGDCWAFVTVAAMESSYLLRHSDASPGSINMSEQELLNCVQYSTCAPPGTDFQDAIFWLMYFGGSIGDDRCLPYTAVQGACQSACSRPYKIARYSFLLGGGDQLRQALREHGPMITTMYVSPFFQAYTGGVFIDGSNGSNADLPNHAVLIIGYFDYQYPGGFIADWNHFDPFHMKYVPPGRRTGWIIKNSWGEDWGIRGYGFVDSACSWIGLEATWVEGKEVYPTPAPTVTGMPVHTPTGLPTATPSP
jgi:C1A family cysteine protease